jgi:predicted nucleic acid-binding Zn ribbon protein
LVIQYGDGKICLRRRKMRPETSPERAGAILPKVFRAMGLESRMEAVRLGTEWVEVVGEAIAARCRPGDVREGTLFVMVENNVWMQELRFHQDRILRRIRKRFPGLGVKGIRLFIERERSEG